MRKEKLIAELRRRQGIFDACFPKQQEAIKGEARQKAVLTSRRAGKTNCVLRWAVLDAYDNPNRRYAYVGLSRKTAKDIVWKELELINEDHDLGLEMLGYCLEANFPNGSQITLYGADQPGWLKKFKGTKFRGIIIDEAGEYDIDLGDFIFRVIRPCLSDLRGTLWLIGTPPITMNNYWYQVIRPDKENRAKGWDVYEWHTFDNPFMKTQFEEDLASLRGIYGDALDELPWYQREWLGKCVIDTSNNVYAYDPERNRVEDFQHTPTTDYIISVDPGWTDETGIVVGAYDRDNRDTLTFVECFHKPKMYPDDIADTIEGLRQKYPGALVLGDYDSADILSHLRERRRIPIVDAQKQKKQQGIQAFNSGLISGKIQYLYPQCHDLEVQTIDLKKEYRASTERRVGDVTVGEWKEHPRQPNDMTDAALYIFRRATNWMFKEDVPRPEYGSKGYYSELEEKLKRQATARTTGQNERWWDKV